MVSFSITLCLAAIHNGESSKVFVIHFFLELTLQELFLFLSADILRNYFFSNKVTKRAFLVFCYLLAGYPHHVCPYYGFSKKWPYRLAHWQRQASTKGESCSSTE